MNVRFEALTPAAMVRLRERMRAHGWEWHGALFDTANLTVLAALAKQAVAVVGDEVVAAGGLVPQSDGSLAAWFANGDVPRRAWPAIVHRIHLELSGARGDGWRVDALVAADNEAAIRFALRFGFNAAPTVMLTMGAR